MDRSVLFAPSAWAPQGSPQAAPKAHGHATGAGQAPPPDAGRADTGVEPVGAGASARYGR